MTQEAGPWLLRYRYLDGTLQAALPLRVVANRPERKVAWLAPGSEISWWALPDGRDPRSLPLGSRFTGTLTTARRRWQGPGVLRVLFEDRPYQVLHFWDGDVFRGWYVNFESPPMWTGPVVESRDWHLDLWIGADGQASWKDEDEAAAAVDAGHLREHELTEARAVGETIRSDVGRWVAEVGDWSTYRPPDEWGPLSLPSWWAAAAPQAMDLARWPALPGADGV